MKRGKFILTLITGIIGFLTLDAFWFEKYIIDWEEFDISDPSESKEKVKIIQISDLHLREIRFPHRNVAKRINEEQPDLLCITGDSVNSDRTLPLLDEFLGLIDYNITKIAILGNKERDGNRVSLLPLKAMYEKHNGTLLINENSVLKAKNRAFNILGIDDYLGGNADYFEAAKNITPNLPCIILNHRPAYRDEIDRINESLQLPIKLVLCGHTHGGQVTFFGKPIFLPDGCGDYLKGWYKSQQSLMYVTKGIGTTALDIRFGARAEAVIFYV